VESANHSKLPDAGRHDFWAMTLTGIYPGIIDRYFDPDKIQDTFHPDESHFPCRRAFLHCL